VLRCLRPIIVYYCPMKGAEMFFIEQVRIATTSTQAECRTYRIEKFHTCALYALLPLFSIYKSFLSIITMFLMKVKHWRTSRWISRPKSQSHPSMIHFIARPLNANPRREYTRICIQPIRIVSDWQNWTKPRRYLTLDPQSPENPAPIKHHPTVFRCTHHSSRPCPSFPVSFAHRRRRRRRLLRQKSQSLVDTSHLSLFISRPKHIAPIFCSCKELVQNRPGSRQADSEFRPFVADCFESVWAPATPLLRPSLVHTFVLPPTILYIAHHFINICGNNNFPRLRNSSTVRHMCFCATSHTK
jgi:hypothetical protein